MPPNSLFPFDLGAWTTADWVNHLWQSTIVAVALLGLLACCQKLRARTRLALGWIALGKFALPVGLLIGGVNILSQAPEMTPATSTPGLMEISPDPLDLPKALAIAPVGRTPAALLSLSPSAAGILTRLWLAGFGLAAAVWIALSVRARRRLLADALPLTEGLLARIDEAATLAGLKRAPRCLIAPGGHGPALVGLWSPVVIVPAGLEDHLTPAEYRAVLLHEFIHLRHRDHVLGALRALHGAILWFNPVVWLLNRRLRVEMEKHCDDRVVEITGDAEAYASGIVKTVRHSLGLPLPGCTGVTTPPVVSRLQNILVRPRQSHDRSLHFLAVATGLTLAGLSGCAGGVVAERPAEPVIAARADPETRSAAEPSSATRVKLANEPDVVLTAGKERPLPKYQYNAERGSFEVTGFDWKPTASADWVDEDIRAVVQRVAAFFTIEVVMPDSLQGRTAAKFADQSWSEIFTAILPPFDHAYRESNGIVQIVHKSDLATPVETTTGRTFTSRKSSSSPAADGSVQTTQSRPDPALRVETIKVDSSGSYFLNGAPISLPALHLEFQRFASEPKAPVIRLTGNPGVRFSVVVALMDELKKYPSLTTLQIVSESTP